MRIFISIFVLLSTLSCSRANTSQKMMGRLQECILQSMPTKLDDEVVYIMDRFEKDGRCKDIDYKSKERVVWPPSKHYYALRVMAAAYVSPLSRFYKNGSLYDMIVKGLDFWYMADPESDNWWYEQIDEQIGIGEVMLLMRKGKKRIPKTLEDSLVGRMKINGGNPERWTGANKAHIAQHWFYRGLLTDDKKLIKESVNYLYDVLSYNDGGEGFQVDGAYFQHGQQLYLGGYAELLLNTVLRIAWVTKGTCYEIGSEQLEVVKSYLMNTIPNIIRGGYINYNCIGRNFCRIGELAISKAWNGVYEQMKDLDVNNTGYDEMVRRIKQRNTTGNVIKSFHHHFYKGDYTVHVRPKYSYSVRLSSPRTILNETLSSENLLGYFVSYGGTTIERKGDEYFNIMPLWDWYNVPGTTTPYMKQIPVVNQFYQSGIADFCGGVSDSLYGVSAVKYKDNYHGVNTSAAKAWFFFDDEVVCLGSGINSPHQVSTSINQCRSAGDVQIVYKGDTHISNPKNEMMSSENISWVLHDSIGYYFPQRCSVDVVNASKENNWKTINRDFKDAVEKGDVFKLSINHGVPKDGSYQYIVVPGVDNSFMYDYARRCPIEIIRNDNDEQIVYHKTLKLYGAVFLKPSLCEYEKLSVQVSEPCILLLNNSYKDHIELHVQDISYQRKKIEVKILLDGREPMSFSADFGQLAASYAGSTIKLVNTKKLK